LHDSVISSFAKITVEGSRDVKIIGVLNLFVFNWSWNDFVENANLVGMWLLPLDACPFSLA